MPKIDAFNELVGESAVRMQAIEDFCGLAVSSASLGIVETARYSWGTLTLRRRKAAASFTYHFVAQNKNGKTVCERVVSCEVVGSAIQADISPIAAALLEDSTLLEQILKTFESTTLWPKLETALVSRATAKATKRGKGPLRA